jgi:hypothetical protein
VVDAVKESWGLAVKARYVADVMRLRFRMRFRRVVKTAFQANSDRALVIRQQYALMMFKLLDEGYRIINVDESSISESDGRRMKWRYYQQTNGVREKGISPSLSLIAAISSDGDAWMSLSQINTDSDAFVLFMQGLIAKLSKDDPNFREKTIF